MGQTHYLRLHRRALHESGGDSVKEKPFSSWYKLLDEKRTKAGNERILADDEAVKVRWGGGGRWVGREGG